MSCVHPHNGIIEGSVRTQGSGVMLRCTQNVAPRDSESLTIATDMGERTGLAVVSEGAGRGVCHSRSVQGKSAVPFKLLSLNTFPLLSANGQV